MTHRENNTLLDNEWIIKEIKGKTFKFLTVDKNEIRAYQHPQNTMKATAEGGSQL